MSTNENAPLAGKGEFENTPSNYNSFNETEQLFRQAMQSAGIHYSGEIIADKDLHRFYIEGHRRSTKNGRYVLHLDGCPAGWFMDYTTGLAQTWRMSGSTGRIPRQMLAEIEKAKHQRAEEQHQKHEHAARKALYIWRRSKPIARQEDHPYLVTKRIQAHGTRISRDALVIPLIDENKRMVSLEFISSEGSKRFLSGGRKRGCFYPIGQPTPRILIAEGFATGASLHEETGQCVIVAFDCGNLLPVAKNVRAMFPTSEIIICGDNDLSGIGQDKARKAALAIKGMVLIPPMANSDWNDVCCKGLS